jgi:hypothetical protein
LIDIYIYLSHMGERNRINCRSWQVFVRMRKASHKTMILFFHLSLSASSVKFRSRLFIYKDVYIDWCHSDNDQFVSISLKHNNEQNSGLSYYNCILLSDDDVLIRLLETEEGRIRNEIIVYIGFIYVLWETTSHITQDCWSPDKWFRM